MKEKENWLLITVSNCYLAMQFVCCCIVIGPDDVIDIEEEHEKAQKALI